MYFVTSNKNKLREFEEILEIKLEQIELDLDEIQEIDVKKVIEHKASEAYAKIQKPVIVEDTGLYIESWKGFPGALAKWVDKTIGFKNIPHLLKGDRRARAETAVGYYDGKEFRSFRGKIEGSIPTKPRGETGFGWDTIFVPEGHEKTFAEMDAEEKNKISMRRSALEKLKLFLHDK
ncbi:non-canonical purine NTP pyrophosphatase, RdgB/HAM1 family [bacterium]|nr:non-canonical purine NTP pyrophosphatase, RdgB/HAM1 family [bacterium]|tara:strand:- start:6082 stop:6612 length:531 start_codon:yes stop_codon:yes gene_type:complete